MAGVEAVTSKPSHTNSPSALPRRAQTFGLRFSFPNETETEKQETEEEDEKDEWKKGITHEMKVCTTADAQVSLSNDMSTTYREANDSNVSRSEKRTNQVAIAVGFHLFPSRTEKLSPRAPMVLRRNAGE